MNSAFRPGDEVIVGDDVHGIVEEVIYCRGRPEALVLVEWWRNGEIVSNRFVPEDLTHR